MVLHDPLTYPQYFAFEEAVEDMTSLFENGNEPSLKRVQYVLLPGILACIDKFKLSNFPKSPTVDNFPATPAKDSVEVVEWLREEISLIVFGEVKVPNE